MPPRRIQPGKSIIYSLTRQIRFVTDSAKWIFDCSCLVWAFCFGPTNINRLWPNVLFFFFFLNESDLMFFGQENERGVPHPSTARFWRFRFPSPNVTLWVKISWLIHSNRSPAMCIQSNLQAQRRCDLCINRGEISPLQHVFSSNLFYSSSYILIWLTLGFFSLIWSPASVPPSSRLGSCSSGRPGTLNAVGSSCGSKCFRWMLTQVCSSYFFFFL